MISLQSRKTARMTQRAHLFTRDIFLQPGSKHQGWEPPIFTLKMLAEGAFISSALKIHIDEITITLKDKDVCFFILTGSVLAHPDMYQ